MLNLTIGKFASGLGRLSILNRNTGGEPAMIFRSWTSPEVYETAGNFEAGEFEDTVKRTKWLFFCDSPIQYVGIFTSIQCSVFFK